MKTVTEVKRLRTIIIILVTCYSASIPVEVMKDAEFEEKLKEIRDA